MDRTSARRSRGAPWVGRSKGRWPWRASGSAEARSPEESWSWLDTRGCSAPRPLGTWLKPLVLGGCVLSLSLQQRTGCSQRHCARIRERGPDLESLALNSSMGLPSWVALGGPVTQPLCVLSPYLCIGCPMGLSQGFEEGTQGGAGCLADVPGGLVRDGRWR